MDLFACLCGYYILYIYCWGKLKANNNSHTRIVHARVHMSRCFIIPIVIIGIKKAIKKNRLKNGFFCVGVGCFLVKIFSGDIDYFAADFLCLHFGEVFFYVVRSFSPEF